jgi:hypothetical protein
MPTLAEPMSKKEWNLFPDDSPSDVDRKLKEHFNYGLYEFIYCMANTYLQEVLFLEPATLIKNYDRAIKDIESLKSSIVRVIKSVDSFIRYELETYAINKDIDIDKIDIDGIVQNYSLEKLYEAFSEWLKILSKEKDNTIKQKRGRKVEPRSVIFYVWSQMMKSPSNNRKQWKKLADFVNWTIFNLSCSGLEKILLPKRGMNIEDEVVDVDEFLIKREVMRIGEIMKRDIKLKEEITSKEKIFMRKIKNKTTMDLKKLGGTTFSFEIGGENMNENKSESPQIIFPNRLELK